MKAIRPVEAQIYCSDFDSSYMFRLHEVAIIRPQIKEK